MLDIMGGRGGGGRRESPTPEIELRHSISRVVAVVVAQGRPAPLKSNRDTISRVVVVVVGA